MIDSWIDEEDKAHTSSSDNTLTNQKLDEILKLTKNHNRMTTDKFDSIEQAVEKILKLEDEILEKTEKIEELNTDVVNVIQLLKDDVSSKRVDSIYNLEMILGSIIVISAIIFYEPLDLLVVPLIILGLGVFFTSLVSKNKVNKTRKEYGI